MAQPLVWIYTDPMTGQRIPLRSAQDVVLLAMESCQKHGWRWPPARHDDAVPSVDVQVEMTLRQAKGEQ